MRTIFIDGIDLRAKSYGFYLTWGTRLPAVATQQVVQVSSPYMDGVVPVKQGMGTGRVNLELVVKGGVNSIYARLTRILMLLRNGRKIAVAEGSRKITSQIVETVISEPEWSALDSVKVRAQITTQPYWSAGKVITQSVPIKEGGQSVFFSEFTGCTGRLMDAVVTVSGVKGQFTVTDTVSGRSWIQKKGSPTGAPVSFNTANPVFKSGETEFGVEGPLRIYALWDTSKTWNEDFNITEAGSKIGLYVRAANVIAGAGKIELKADKWYM